MVNEAFYYLALSMIPGLGAIQSKKLVAYCGGVEAVFSQNKPALLKIPGIGKHLAEQLIHHQVFGEAEREIRYCEERSIQLLAYSDTDFPRRLKQCVDSPLVLFVEGELDLNPPLAIAIVGTRRSTNNGKQFIYKLLEELSRFKLQIISGMALGIDAHAHRGSLLNGLPTVGVVAHPLHMLYPSSHRKLRHAMLEKHSGLVSEYSSSCKLLPGNFPMRNRIVAGMSDATLVVESGEKGGALITADLANSYNRDVFAVPGRWNDTYSKGCNHLIKTHQAQLVESASDLIHYMGWETQEEKKSSIQRVLAFDLDPEEQVLVDLIKDEDSMAVDMLRLKSGFSAGKLASTLLQLELNGVIQVLPGDRYTLN
jgi:DNA processing protein